VTAKRRNVEFLLGWLDALRREDLAVVAGAMAPDVFWQGPRPEYFCSGAEDVVRQFLERRAEGFDIDAIEIIGAEAAAILCVRIPGGYELDGERVGPFYNLFRIEDGRVVRIEDYLDRDAALEAAAGAT
jgi:limonene-1,2-epoxide hydrolase